tara:strand:+ start:2655 stop:2825 length:171 start_codon:yes stop_codon:yes gene_type:complete
MQIKSSIFSKIDAADEKLADEVAKVAGLRLPPECIDGVAVNARLIQHHVDIMRGKS